MQDEHGNFPDWGKESGTAALGSSSPPIMLGGGPLRSYNSYNVSDTVSVVGAVFGLFWTCGSSSMSGDASMLGPAADCPHKTLLPCQQGAVCGYACSPVRPAGMQVLLIMLSVMRPSDQGA